MFIASIILSAIGFVLLVLTAISNSHVWTWLLIIVVLAGIICFGIGEWNKRKHQLRD